MRILELLNNAELVERIAKRFCPAPELWAHNDKQAPFAIRANAMTKEAAHARGDIIRGTKQALEEIAIIIGELPQPPKASEGSDA